MTKKIGLFYGSSTCYTEMAAEKIQACLAPFFEVDVHNVESTSLEQANDYDVLILGIPTWDYGEIQEDWEEAWPGLFDVNFSSKLVALFGLGDQVGYPEWFLDAMGILHDKIVELGATIIGNYPIEGFEFEGSKALTDDKQSFVGLALDYENEFEKVETRIQDWCNEIQPIITGFFYSLEA